MCAVDVLQRRRQFVYIVPRVLERSKRVASEPISIDPQKHYCIGGVGVTGPVYSYRMTDDHNL